MKFQVERIQDIVEEIKELHREHFVETEVPYKGESFNPDYNQFCDLERAGSFVLFTIRDGLKLVGNLGFVLHISRHTSRPSAYEDFYFVLPEYRRGFLAIRFLRYAVRVLAESGYEEIGMSSKLTANKDIEPILTRVGFRPVAKFYHIEGKDVLQSTQSAASA